jgi:hypothetical protein
MYTGLRHFPARHVSAQLHPHCTYGTSPCIYKREVQALPAKEGGERVTRENGLTNMLTHSLSLSHERL